MSWIFLIGSGFAVGVACTLLYQLAKPYFNYDERLTDWEKRKRNE